MECPHNSQKQMCVCVCVCVCLCTLQVLACGIVQLVMAVTPQKKEWRSHSSGVLCLVQDKSVHSTFMRLYCVKVKLTDNKKTIRVS